MPLQQFHHLGKACYLRIADTFSYKIGLNINTVDNVTDIMQNTRCHLCTPDFSSGINHLISEQQNFIEVVDELIKHVKHITDIISVQQSCNKVGGLIEIVSVNELIEDAIKVNESGLTRHKVDLKREYEQLPEVLLDSRKVLQIIINLISNAKYAISDNKKQEKLIIIRSRKVDGERFQIEISDTGHGISSENMTKIFAGGFTTKKSGHGYGLHSAAIAAKEMDGSLTAHSDGVGKGAKFVLELPLKIPSVKNAK